MGAFAAYGREVGQVGDRERAARRGSSVWARSPGAADTPDVIEQGGRPPRWPWLSGRRPAAGIALAALAVGLLLGFVGGHLQATGQARSARPAGRAHATLPPPVTPPITATGARCAVQLGRTLQLGLEIVNQSDRAVTLRQVAPVLPLSGMRPLAARWGPCGSLPLPVPQPSMSLSPGATRWLTVTFRVLVRCPQAFPVLFKVSYAQSGRAATTDFDSFPDLGQVRYNNCPTDPGS
jgi:hypothetical protein